ncbi:MAG: NAD-dependent epimerase/dehydratase family protein [Hespellia sp.]|nr:NAD-dependent epimerase/dehydratase family protein [Hespellia sp.]
MLKELQIFRDRKENECYLVTGAGGHLGGAIVRELVENHKSVHAFVLSGMKHCLPSEANVFYGDVRDKDSMNEFFTVTECSRVIVIHCAAIVTIKKGYDKNVMDVNVEGTKNVVEQCVEKKVDKFIYVSSVHAIPELPNNKVIREVMEFSPELVKGIYAKSKAIATQYVLTESRKRNLDVSVVHPSGIIGPYDSGNNHLTAMIQTFCRGKLPVAVKGGYDFVDVRDVVDGILACANFGRNGRCYILSGHYMTVQELLINLESVSGVKAPRIYLHRAIAKIFVPVVEWHAKVKKKRPFYTAYAIYVLGTNARFSHRRATRELGYEARDIYNTLKDTVLWMRN